VFEFTLGNEMTPCVWFYLRLTWSWTVTYLYITELAICSRWKDRELCWRSKPIFTERYTA